MGETEVGEYGGRLSWEGWGRMGETEVGRVGEDGGD